MKAKIIYMFTIICIVIGMTYIVTEYFTPKQIINITEDSKIVGLERSYAKGPIYNVIVNTKNTNKEFKFIVEKNKFDELDINQIIKINYDYAIFPHYVDTVNNVIIVN